MTTKYCCTAVNNAIFPVALHKEGRVVTHSTFPLHSSPANIILSMAYIQRYMLDSYWPPA